MIATGTIFTVPLLLPPYCTDNVLDPAYSPTDPDEISLFKEQKKFVYSALEHCLQTNMGKNIVREHAFDFDAQVVFAKIVKHYTASTAAKISSGTTLSYLTSAKYGSSWTGTAEGLSCIGKPSTHLQQYRANYGTFATATLPQFARVLCSRRLRTTSSQHYCEFRFS